MAAGAAPPEDQASGMQSARIDLAYEGTDFSGWARQPGMRTVEACMIEAFERLGRRPAPTLTVAGRTDAGVHADAQVVSHPGEPLLAEALNSVLPADVAVRSSTAAPGFDARGDATSRAYRYSVLLSRERPLHCRRNVMWEPKAVDIQTLHECAAMIPGIRDLTAFTPSNTNHVRFERRVLHATWEEHLTCEGLRLDFLIEAESFLRHMNRILVGTMLETARGVLAVDHFASLLTGRPRSEAGATAPAQGLTLIGVGYGERVIGQQAEAGQARSG